MCGKPIDLTGKRYGRLVVLEKTEMRRSTSPVWRCRCDCGNICYPTGRDLCRGHTKSCGCIREEKAVKGALLKRFVDKQDALDFVEGIYNSKANENFSCSVVQKECSAAGSIKDLRGKRFGRLAACEPTGQRKDGSVIWRCVCDCGGVCLVSQRDLAYGGTKSCGCLKLEHLVTSSLRRRFTDKKDALDFVECLYSDKSFLTPDRSEKKPPRHMKGK